MKCRLFLVFFSQPCHLKDWEMQVHFKIHGQGKKNLNGDGLAIWYSKERMQKGECCGPGRPRAGATNTLCLCRFTGPVFGNMDNFTGLGVFVDTYPNEEKHLEVRRSSAAQV